MNADVVLVDGAFLYMLATAILLFWVKTDLINKLKLLIFSTKGAKLFALYRKDGTREEFVMTAKTGGKIEHAGDPYLILRSGVMHDRAKNAPVVTLAEGNLQSIDPLALRAPRVDSKQLRALFFAEREKAKDDINPELKILKILVVILVLVAAAGAIMSYLAMQNTSALTAAGHTAAAGARAVTQL